MRNSKNKKTKFGKFVRQNIVIIALVGLFVVLSFSSIRLAIKQSENSKQIKKLESELKKEKKRSKEVRDYEEYINSKEYKESVAKDKLDLIYPDEILLQGK